MPSSLRYNCLCLVFILTVGNGILFAQDEAAAPDLENIDQLIQLLYSVEDFQLRFGSALDNNLIFTAYTDDAFFVETLTEEARANALRIYGASIGRALRNLNQEEVDSMIALLQSPSGEVVRKLFAFDNSEVEPALAQYVNTITDNALSALDLRDSLLYVKEYPFDLSEIMNGTYTDSIREGRIVRVERTLSSQKETLNGVASNYSVEWLTNSQYLLKGMPGNSAFPADGIVANIYEVKGGRYYYIYQLPNGEYGKNSLKRTSFESYSDEVKAFRWSQYDKYADASTSPLDETEIEGFKAKGGHKFFDVSEKFRVTASVEREVDETKTITLATSDKQEKTYRVYGKASFKIDGKPLTLDLYEPVKQFSTWDQPMLFVPFRDETSGDLSYGGGRYIDIDLPSGNEIVIDFNKSYNPYCAYTNGYSCPIPPEENTLEVAIEAGIKAPEHK